MNKDQFCQLYENYVDEVSSFLTYYTKERSELEDLLQEVFLRLWKYREKMNLEDPFLKTYILKTGRNVALNFLELKKREPLVLREEIRTVVNGYPSEGSCTEKEITQHYVRALSKAPEKAREAYLLSREEGLSYNEIAENLSISPKTVEVHISKVIKILKKEFKDLNII